MNRLAQSPYLKAIDHKVVLAFVPYQNLKHMKVGTKLYGCSWGLVACSNVGKVTAVLDGEVTTSIRTTRASQRGHDGRDRCLRVGGRAQTVLFAGGKPLWLF